MHTSKYEELAANENKKKQQKNKIHQKSIFVNFENEWMWTWEEKREFCCGWLFEWLLLGLEHSI